MTTTPSRPPGSTCHPTVFDGPAPRAGAVPDTIVDRWNAAGGARAGEIKPHTTSGIKAGLRQLAARAGTRRPLQAAVLVTYRRKPGDDGRAEILVAEVMATDLATWVAGSRSRTRGQPRPPLPIPTAWYRLTDVPFGWNSPIPLAECPTCVGNLLEVLARQALDKRRGGRFNLSDRNRRKQASAGGADLFEIHRLREEVGYLRELVQELATGEA